MSVSDAPDSRVEIAAHGGVHARHVGHLTAHEEAMLHDSVQATDRPLGTGWGGRAVRAVSQDRQLGKL